MASPTDQSPAIRINGVSKCFELYDKPVHRLLQTLCAGHKRFYREFWALRGIDFAVRKGECVGLIGRNGAGKSTLLQIITGVMPPTAGTVEIAGRVGALLELGSGFNPEFTGRENVYLNAAILGLTREETDRKFPAIAQFAEIGDFIDQPVKSYSSGMMIRLAFAAMTAVIPEIMIIDEALSVGDIFFQQKCIDFIKNGLKGCTKLMVSHDLPMLQAFADRIAILDAGRIVFFGDPVEAIRLYTTMEHSARYGTPPPRSDAAGSLGSGTPEANANANANATLPDSLQTIPADLLSGSGKIRFLAFSLTANGAPAETVLPGDRLEVNFLLESAGPATRPLIGYFFRDRTGQQVFGSNTDLAAATFELPGGGQYSGGFRFVWPRLKPGEYTLTLGVGEGTTDTQVIQCWGHNLCKVTACNPKSDWSALTYELQDFRLRAVAAPRS